MRALLFALREDWYALGLEHVREVIEPTAVTRVPGAPAAVLGIVNVRGDVVGVLDTAALLGLAPVAVGEVESILVVADADGAPVGLASTAPPVTETLGEDLGSSALAAGARRWRASVGPAVELELGALLGAVA